MTDIEHKYEDGKLSKILIKIGEGKPNLRVEGLKDIHPIYEALTALFKRNLSDSEISQRYSKDEKSLREVIATEAFLDRIGRERRYALVNKLTSGGSISDITDIAALEISENKRVRDGKVLDKASLHSSDQFFRKALSETNLSYIYIDKSQIDFIKEKAKEARIKRIVSYIASGVSIIALSYCLFAGYVHISFGKNKEVKNTENSQKVEQVKK